MAGSPSDRVLGQVHRLFHFGAVGTMSDAQLLDRFVSRRDEAAEAAFEELVIRHGPMVLRVCRSVLHDAHDAEDAFQAVFLVLASRAGSIRRSGSVASWLFGVAHRVATRARRSAARRHRLDQLVAERTSESYRPSENDPDWEILHEEIDGLPERLRAPVVLCYLQGLTYAAAAHQLGVSAVAIRGRLARARERLRPPADPARRDGPGRSPRRRCGRTGPGGDPVDADPVYHSHRAGIRGGQHGRRPGAGGAEFHAVQPGQSRGGACSASASGAATGPGMPSPGRPTRRPTDEAGCRQDACIVAEAKLNPSSAYRLTGSVRVEGTGEPVAGATVDGHDRRLGPRSSRCKPDGPVRRGRPVTPSTSRQAAPAPGR